MPPPFFLKPQKKMKKGLYIGLGVLAVGVAFYFYNKSKKPKETKPAVKPENKAEEPKSNFVKCGDEAQGHWYQKSYPCRSSR